MKKNLLICFCLLSISIFSQDNEAPISPIEDRNELKINGLFLILGAVELDYQYLINDESGIGVDILVAVEAFGMLNSVNDYTYDNSYDPATDSYYYGGGYEEDIIDFALGIGTGVKLLTRRGFVVEIDLGIGRNLFKNDRDFTIIGKGGINLGYRF